MTAAKPLSCLQSSSIGMPFKRSCRSRPKVTTATTGTSEVDVAERLGYSQAPVVLVGEHNHWSGFQPDQIARVEQALRSGPTALSQ